MRYILLSVALLWGLCSHDAHAQLEGKTSGKQRRENRRALRDANRYPAEYKESHLAVTKAELKDGNGGRQAVVKPADGRADYQFDRTGEPRASEPSRANLRLRRKEKQPTP
ncbi:hypothetical protein [Hymenobacter mucosus]|uniref:YD repeat-containing protein n=1 Tax=Hymenobacter mucosus TaxID=1411120 RepID=A0A238X4K2_9BACT|nr:hypothetical protein [Hymenobacter mucosus]SNR53284.1 hypothetical protein SAMN06269173_103436 [Hymenobacter mucosus]